MVTDVADTGKAIPAVAGAATGLLSFLGLVLWFGMPIIPSTENLPTVMVDKPSPYPTVAPATGSNDPGEQVYQTVCAACHQGNGQGLPGAFPPLAESEWVAGDPETLVRILIAGLSGPIQVKGQAFNALMPPPPGLDDEKIAAVATYVRSNFGNKASAVDTDLVKQIRGTMADRNKPWTAEELQALRKPGDTAPAATNPSGDTAASTAAGEAAPGAAPVAPQGAPAGAPAPAPTPAPPAQPTAPK